jgi:hypothetical protein
VGKVSTPQARKTRDMAVGKQGWTFCNLERLPIMADQPSETMPDLWQLNDEATRGRAPTTGLLFARCRWSKAAA